MRKTKGKKGITLVALVVTIVILLILAGISISALTQTGLFSRAKQAEQKSKESQEQENTTLGTYENEIDKYISGKTEDTKVLQADGSWNNSKKVNSPQLMDGMTGVYWDEKGQEVTVTADNQDNWYDYENQKWANAKTKDGSYWVWIPRYAYKIESGCYTSTAGTITVKFLKETSKTEVSNTEIKTT